MMRLAIVQTNPVFGEVERNVMDALELMNSAWADLYVLPELFNTGYNFITTEEVVRLSEDDAGETINAMLNFAKVRSCYVVFGYAEKSVCPIVIGESSCQRVENNIQGTKIEDQRTRNEEQRTKNEEQRTKNEEHQTRYYNSAALVGPEGIIGNYRKVHLYYREKLFFAPGNLGFPVFDLPFGKVGMMICFDWIYPESARSLAMSGAQLIAHPSNLVLPYCPDGMITRCLENRVFAATADRVGVENRNGVNLTYIGTSQIVSNKGRILARCCDDKPEIAVVEVDLAQASNKKLNEFNDLLHDRKREQYQW